MSKCDNHQNMQERIMEDVSEGNYLKVYVASRLGWDVSCEKTIYMQQPNDYVPLCKYNSIYLACEAGDLKMIKLLVALGVKVHAEDVKQVASTYVIISKLLSKGEKPLTNERPDDILKILKFFHDIGADTSYLKQVCPRLKKYVSEESSVCFENFLTELDGSKRDCTDFDFSNFVRCFNMLKAEYGLDFPQELECSSELYEKLESGDYGTDPDTFYHEAVGAELIGVSAM